MTNEMASKVLHRFYKCRTEGDYLCASSTCQGCEKYDSDAVRKEAILIGAKALENTITGWLSSALETIRSGVADKLSKDNVTAYRVNNIIRIDIKEG